MTTVESMRSAPAVDVVMATRNSERFLEQCLISIESQGVPDIRITIIDAGSTDQTRAIAARFGAAVVIPQTGSGLAQAWNQGIQAGNRDIVAMIDSDDTWTPQFLHSALTALVDAPHAQCAMAQAKFVLDSPTPPLGFRPDLVNAERIGWMPGTTVFRRTIFQRLGYFPEDMQIASDIEWFARLREQGLPIVQLPLVGLYKRIHEGNLSLSGSDPSVYRKELLQIARARLKTSISNDS